MLTSEQKAHFDTFGFLLMRQCFSPGEMAEISRLFDEVMEEVREGKPFTGERRQMLLSLIEHRPALSRLIEDDRIFYVTEDLLGPGFIWIAGDGNYYVGDGSWHSDMGTRIPACNVIKIAFYLDSVRRHSGCLRVIPGSHREPLWTELKVLY